MRLNQYIADANSATAIDIGILSLTVIEADLTRDTETFGKMDPFVKFTYGDLKFMTTEKSNAGKKPIWNETFLINVKSL